MNIGKSGIFLLAFAFALLGFVFGLTPTTLFSGMLIHEEAHLITAKAFGLRIDSWDLTHVAYENSTNPQANTVIRLAGGTAQAVSSIIILWIVTMLEKRITRENEDDKGLLARIVFFGLKIGILVVFLNGIATAIWEGFFYESYRQIYGNQVLWGTISILCGAAASYVLYMRKPLKIYTEKAHTGEKGVLGGT